MLHTRQNVHPLQGISPLITTLIYDFPEGYVVPDHFHEQDQLVYACRGVMTVRTRQGTWVTPPQRAVWIPAGILHGIRMSGRVAMRTLYLRPGLAALPRSCCVINVAPLLRELILHACTFRALYRQKEIEAHMIDVILDQLEVVQAVPLQLANPLDPRAVRVAETLLANPGDQRPLKDLCRMAGASKRTVERLFLAETRMTLGKWRQQLRLLHAMRLLAEGKKITHAALEAGYSTPSAFVSMFKKALGTTPGRYFAGSTSS